MGMAVSTIEVKRFDVYLVNLDPTVGAEIQKTRPCLVVSPNEMNGHIATVIVAPMTTHGKHYPTQVACTLQEKASLIILDHLRTVDKKRLLKKLGRLCCAEQAKVLTILAELFAP